MSAQTKAISEASYMAGMDLAFTADGASLVWSYEETVVMRWQDGAWTSALRKRAGKGDAWDGYRQACLETQRAIDAGRIKARAVKRISRFVGGKATTD